MNSNKLESVLRKCGVRDANIKTFSVLILKYFNEFSISKDIDQAFFLANTLHETGLYSRLSENLNYSSEGLLKVFPNKFNQKLAEQLGRTDKKSADQIGIAKVIYGGRFGNDTNLDGYKYRGKGLMQTTFKNNYVDLKNATGIDVVSNPDLLIDPDMAVKSACIFYKNRVLGKATSLEQSRKIINGGSNGLAEVQKLYKIIINEK